MLYRLGEFAKILNFVSDVLRRTVVQIQRRDHLEIAKVFRLRRILLICNDTLS